jgi:hypothetical protein
MRAQRAFGAVADARQREAQRFDDARPEADRIVVALVQRQPREWLARRRRLVPLREERRLARACGRGQQRQPRVCGAGEQ